MISTPTQVGGGEPGGAVPSTREPDQARRARVLVRASGRVSRGCGHGRTRGPDAIRRARRRRHSGSPYPRWGSWCRRCSRAGAFPSRRRRATGSWRRRSRSSTELLIAFVASLGVVGLASAFMLGNLRDSRKAGIGLGIILGCIVTVVVNIPGAQSTGDLVFIALRFVVAWVARLCPPRTGRAGRGRRGTRDPGRARA